MESCELSFDDYRVPADAVLGAVEGEGFAADDEGPGDRAGSRWPPGRSGSAQAAFDDALAYAQERESFGKPIWKHQSIGNYLADMATKLTAARQCGARCRRTVRLRAAAATWRPGWRSCSPPRRRWRSHSTPIRIHGGYGYSTEYDVERYFRDAPLMIVGEGTNEIQRNVIAAQLISRGGLV